MTMEEEEPAAAPAFQMNRVYPDVPAPPSDTPSPPRHTHFRKDDPEESLLGSFIQWVHTNKETPSLKKKMTEQSNDANTDHGDKPDNEPHTESVEKPPTFANKRKREERRNKRSNETAGQHDNVHQRFTSNPAFKDVHLSRPATPQPAEPTDTSVYDPTRDKNRIIYLTVLLEEQLDHVRHVIKTMITHKAEKFRISSIIKVKHALSQFKSQLLGLFARNEATMKMFGSRADLEEFFRSVETVCGSVQEIAMEGCEHDTDMMHVMGMGLLGKNKDLKDGKTRIRKSKKYPPTAYDVTSLFEKEEQNDDTLISGPDTDAGMDGINLLSRKKIHNHNGRRGKSCKSADGEIDVESRQENDSENVRKSSSMSMETAQRKTSDNKPRLDRNAEDDNDVVTHKRRTYNVKSECNKVTTSHDVTNKDVNVAMTASQKAERSASEVKRLLYKNAKQEQIKGKYPCKTVESEPGDGTDPLADNGADWPLIHAKQLGLKHREQEINSLMEDIDVLMSKTELRNGQVIISGMTFEELMMGPGQQRGRPQVIMKPGTSKTRLQTEPGPEGRKNPGANSTRPQTKPGEVTPRHKVVVKNKKGKKNSNTRDEFIDELDKLLNECENI